MNATSTRRETGGREAEPGTCELCGQSLADADVLSRYRSRLAARDEAVRTEVRAELDALARAEAPARQHAAELVAARRLDKRVRQMEQTNRGLREQLDGYQRRIDGLSSGNRGRFSEDDVLAALRTEFPFDRFELVRSGPARRPDIVQSVCYQAGSVTKEAGVILYECKDRLRWEGGFVAQARAARERHHAAHAVVVTHSFPAGRTGFVAVDDVLVVEDDGALDIARVLRSSMVQLAKLQLDDTQRAAREAELVQYLASDDFTVAFGAVCAATKDVRAQLANERGWHDRAWAKRESCYRRLEANTSTIDEEIQRALSGATVGLPATALTLVPTSTADLSDPAAALVAS